MPVCASHRLDERLDQKGLEGRHNFKEYEKRMLHSLARNSEAQIIAVGAAFEAMVEFAQPPLAV